MLTLKEVFSAYFECRKNKRKSISQIKFEINYERNCILLWRDILHRKYKIGKSICFIVTRPKLREVFAASFRDRIVHHIIVHKLEPLLEEEFIYDAYNCRKGKGVLFGVNRLHEAVKKCSDNYTKDCYIAKFDLKGFFMSIYKPLLWNLLKEFIIVKCDEKDHDLLLYLVNKVVNNCPLYNCIKKSPYWMWNRLEKDKSLFTVGMENGLPIGNLTSLIFANFYLSRFDHLMLTIFDFYGRYVDDFYIIDKDKLKILNNILTIKTETLKYHVKLHPKKVYIQHYSKGCSFTGSYIKYSRVYIGNRTISNCMRCIHGNNMSININRSEKFSASINSYFGYLCHCNAYAIKYNLLNLVSPLWREFINVSPKLDKVICICNRMDTIKKKIKQL